MNMKNINISDMVFIYDLYKSALCGVLDCPSLKMFFSWFAAIQQSFGALAYPLWLKLVLKVEASLILNFSLASVL